MRQGTSLTLPTARRLGWVSSRVCLLHPGYTEVLLPVHVLTQAVDKIALETAVDRSEAANQPWSYWICIHCLTC